MILFHLGKITSLWGFPGGSDGKEFACSARDPGLIPRLGRSLGEGNGNPLQYSSLWSLTLERHSPMGGGSFSFVSANRDFTGLGCVGFVLDILLVQPTGETDPLRRRNKVIVK